MQCKKLFKNSFPLLRNRQRDRKITVFWWIKNSSNVCFALL